MAEIVVLPQQGNSVEEVVLLDWSVAEGDSVSEGTVLCEVETDKATMEVESTAAGTVLKLLAAAGDEVPVKSPLVVVGEAGEDISGLDLGGAGADQNDEPAAQDAAEAPGSGGSPTEAAGAAGTASSDSAASSASSASRADARSSGPAAATSDSSTGNVGVSPRARMRAAERGIDPAPVSGTGPGGRIIERDILSAAPATTAAARGTAASTAGTGIGGRITTGDAAAAASTGGPRTVAEPVTGGTSVTEELPVSGVRRVIADRMLASLQSTAQLTLDASADARALRALRARFKQAGEELGLSGVNLNDMLMFAVVETLHEFPELNAHFTGDTIRRFSGVDLGFAVDTPRGLLVPTVRDAHTLSLSQLSRQVKELARRAVDGKATNEDLAPATFTVTNLGAFGIERFTPVLNPPQVAILGVNAINLKAVEGSDGSVEHIPHMGLSLTINHQAVDGAPGARFLQTLSRRLAEFDLLLAR